jgi:hypothetical protein
MIDSNGRICYILQKSVINKYFKYTHSTIRITVQYHDVPNSTLASGFGDHHERLRILVLVFLTTGYEKTVVKCHCKTGMILLIIVKARGQK